MSAENVMSYEHIRVEPVSTKVGAEISGVDLAVPLAAEAFAEIRRPSASTVSCSSMSKS